jgi:hypothetical protein
MADKSVRLTHSNGATVQVAADRADDFVATGQFTKTTAKSGGSSTSKTSK